MAATPVSLTTVASALETYASLKTAYDTFQKDYQVGCERFRRSKPLVVRLLNPLALGTLLINPEERGGFNKDYYRVGKEVREYLSTVDNKIIDTLKSRSELTSADELDLSSQEFSFVRRFTDDKGKEILNTVKEAKSIHDQEAAAKADTRDEATEFEITPKVIASLVAGVVGLSILTVWITFNIAERIDPFKGSVSDVTICKAAIAGANFKSSFDHVVFDGTYNGAHRLHYFRRTDGKRWDFTCRIEGNSVDWRVKVNHQYVRPVSATTKFSIARDESEIEIEEGDLLVTFPL